MTSLFDNEPNESVSSIATHHLEIDLDHLQAARWTPAVPALFSAFGSLLIVQRIVRSKQLLTKPYERLILGLSVVDTFTSLHLMIVPFFFRPFTAPSAACTLHGFLLTLGFAGPMYNASLAIYYVLIIVYNVPQQRIARHFEPWLHSVAIGYGMLGAIAGLPLQVFNPEKDALACWAMEWPHGCTTGDASCDRGASAAIFALAVGLLPLVGVLFLLIVVNVVIYCTVRRILAKTEKYTNPAASTAMGTPSSSVISLPFPHNGSVDECGERSVIFSSTSDGVPPSPTKSPIRRTSSISAVSFTPPSTTKAVAAQSVLYVLAYVMCFSWTLILMVVGVVDPVGVEEGNYFVLSILQMTFFPSQGLFNAFVYVRPMVARLRRHDPRRSRWHCVWSVLFEET